jgi:hypothetical protein
MAPINFIKNTISTIESDITNIFNTINTLFDCTLAFFNFVIVLFLYIGDFTTWIFIYFFPWLGQYFECALQKIIYLPKCFLWYALDCMSWIIYLPFRIIFWLLDYIFNLGIEDFVHDYFWCLLEDLDKFIHDDGENNLGTGFHIIHFQDSVMETCYNCNIQSIGKGMPNTCNLNSTYNNFINCRGGEQSGNTCKSKIGKYFDCDCNSNSVSI